MSDEHRTRGFIPWSNVDRRLRATREVWVATASVTGADAVPVWFWWDGESLFFSTKSASRKARNIARQPAIVVHNGDGADPIIVKGDAERVTDLDELERVDRAYREKYVDPYSGVEATIYVQGDSVFRVRPRLVMAWSYATCSSRTDWEFDAAATAGHRR